jgi:MoaA/NifB/PqqE/SkfB family radical SAM enzyme
MLNTFHSLTIEITNRCNLRCRICGIWKERPLRDLLPEDIERVVRSLPKLGNVSLTGGEALLHPDIERIYRFLFKRYLAGKLKAVDIATNGCSPLVTDFLRRNARYLRPLTLSVSVDGIGKFHDSQRGRRGAFLDTLAQLRSITTMGVPVSLKFVASRLNYPDIDKVASLARTLGCRFYLKTVEELPAYYHRSGTGHTPLLGRKAKAEVLKAIQRLPVEINWPGPLGTFSLRCHERCLKEGNLDFIRGCQTPARSLFITSHGEIFNCLYQDKIGTLSAWPTGIDRKAARQNTAKGERGTCPKCLSYHGYLREINSRSPRPRAARQR